ncbi:MAG: LutC/YkgG family protein [Sediminibacterium sp.]|jgi:L-lactate dehydrogenase complex protein LldG|nr:LUD domain-containing protein [Chitinophagaceae bacterium]MCA6446539.1 LUD domain-containing protein [Chitinophagaceae bacterium]
MSNSREQILQKIKQALQDKVPVPFPDVPLNLTQFNTSEEEDLALEFASHFSNLQGRFSYCSNEAELILQLKTLIEARKWDKLFCREIELQNNLATAGLGLQYFHDLSGCDCAITGCEYLVARTGSILLSSASESGRTTSVYAPVHICIAYSSQLVHDIDDALMQVRAKYGAHFPSLVSLATGPSRTADIEKTLVVGVHGPKEVFCFLVQQ